MRLITHAFAKKSAESDLPSADVMLICCYLPPRVMPKSSARVL